MLKLYALYLSAIHIACRVWCLSVDNIDINVFFSCTVPAKPINLHVSSVRRLQITVVWNSPQVTVSGITDTSTLNYYVSYKNLESKATRQIRSTTERASLNLKANTRYEIKVKSYKVFNTRVAGSWSDSLKIKTNESGKSSAPAITSLGSAPETIHFVPPCLTFRLLFMCEVLGIRFSILNWWKARESRPS